MIYPDEMEVICYINWKIIFSHFCKRKLCYFDHCLPKCTWIMIRQTLSAWVHLNNDNTHIVLFWSLSAWVHLGSVNTHIVIFRPLFARVQQILPPPFLVELKIFFWNFWFEKYKNTYFWIIGCKHVKIHIFELLVAKM